MLSVAYLRGLGVPEVVAPRDPASIIKRYGSYSKATAIYK